LAHFGEMGLELASAIMYEGEFRTLKLERWGIAYEKVFINVMKTIVSRFSTFFYLC
jgi:hypothetical protein